jgi:hydroxymethylpyrimidine pyrophosphatase-like HAD family hydrolase
VHAMHDSGIQFALTSGRPPKGMSMLLQPLAITTPIAGFNGGLFTKADMTIIESHTLDAKAAYQTAEVIEKEGLDVWIYSGDDWLIRKADAPHREREEHTVQFPPTVVESWTDDIWDKVVKITGVAARPPRGPSPTTWT